MKNSQIEALELKIDSLKVSLRNKKLECKKLEEENKKLQDILKALYDVGVNKDEDFKTTIETFAKDKEEFEEKLKIKDQTSTQQKKESILTQLLVDALKNIKLS